MNDIFEALPGSTDAWTWWEGRRLRYNIGLAVAGWAAYAAFWLGMFGFGDMRGVDLEVILRGTLVLGTGYLVVMAAANLAYLLGVAAETVLKPANVEAFRERAWNLGFWGSCALPFLFPLLTVGLSVTPGGGWD